MLIGISGKIKSGKNTVGKMLCDLIYDDCYKSVIVCSFADNLKKIVSAITGCKYEDLNNQEFKNKHIPDFTKITKNGIITHIIPSKNVLYHDIFRTYEEVTYREALQFFGNKFRSEFGKDFWIKMLKSELPEEDGSEYIIIITDVRHKNEASFIKSEGGILIRVNRKDSETSNNISEIDLDDYLNFDYIIENDDTLEELRSKVKLVYKSIKCK